MKKEQQTLEVLLSATEGRKSRIRTCDGRDVTQATASLYQLALSKGEMGAGVR